MWGFWEGGHWRPKAALWWTRWEGSADAGGVCEVPAFFGRHMVEVNGADKEVLLRKSARVVRLDCTGGSPDAWSVVDGD